MYQIKAVSSITGLNPETLRAWERRYGAVIPLRDAKGRRLYSEQDIDRLTLLNNATLSGHSISKVAVLKDKELQALLKNNNQPLVSNNDLFLTQIIEAVVQYKFDDCEDLLRRALLAMEPLSYARDLLAPALQKIGQLWHDGELTIAQEHMFSNCVKRIVLSMVHNLMPFSGYQAKLIFTAPSGELHEFGILLSCLLAAHQNHSCYYLGPNLPSEEIVKVHKQMQPDVIVMSLVNSPPEQKIIAEMEKLDKEIDGSFPIWVGGSGAQTLIAHKSFGDRFQIFSSLDEFCSRLRILNLDKAKNSLSS